MQSEASQCLLRGASSAPSRRARAKTPDGVRGVRDNARRTARKAHGTHVTLPQGLRALRFRSFRLFFIGQGVSQIGSWLQMIATSWLVYHLSGSAFLLGLAAFALQIPFFVLAPLAGVFVDRLARRGALVPTHSTPPPPPPPLFLLL